MLDQEYNVKLLNQPIDCREDFTKIENTYFLVDRVSNFCPEIGKGELLYKRYARKVRTAFDDGRLPFEPTQSWEFPPHYSEDFVFPMELQFITSRTLRIRIQMNPYKNFQDTSLMIPNILPLSRDWKMKKQGENICYESQHGRILIEKDPFHIEVQDSSGKVLTRTNHLKDSTCLQNCDPMPFAVVRRTEDTKLRGAASFTLFPDERIYGCGESFTTLNKRGQKVILYVKDPHGVQTSNMYKPVPFFMSSRGYGMFYHTSAPMTFDFGHTHDQASVAYVGDDLLDLFIFIGDPKQILEEYTAITGRSPLPPFWSFGLWMSRITYSKEEEVRDVAQKLRRYKIPCDVIHLDTGWFEEDWNCDYEFSKEKFNDPVQMIENLKKQGFRISLWQYPYLTPKNKLFQTLVSDGMAVNDKDGGLPTYDAVMDFSNETTLKWYQKLLKGLLEKGVACIKADFGEAAPINGLYASGKSGFYEHNLYPLRYNKAVFDITRESTGEGIIWARSGWAGSQRYPIHWGGDSDNTSSAMAASLRGGLSLGLSGFSFWSHDIGGFVKPSPKELYARWLPFGMLTSHSRCHGAPPKEPWYYDEEFIELFRQSVELKYKLLPYVYTQAYQCSQKGYPMIRTLFFEYPEDPTAWFIEDQYLFGENLLVAPIFEEKAKGRKVYLPEGIWIDYFTLTSYEGGK